MGIEDGKQYTIRFLEDINEKRCMRMSSIILNPAKNISDEFEFDMKNSFILHEIQLFGKKISIDVVYMPNSAGYRYIVFARDNLSGWVEG